MIGNDKDITSLALDNARGLVDWYGNRAKLAQKYGDVTEVHFLKSRELYYSGLVNSIENKLTQQQKAN